MSRSSSTGNEFMTGDIGSWTPVHQIMDFCFNRRENPYNTEKE